MGAETAVGAVEPAQPIVVIGRGDPGAVVFDREPALGQVGRVQEILSED